MADKSSVNMTQPIPSLPKIALIVDTEYWAFANIAHQLCCYLSDRFNFTVLSMSRIKDITQLLSMVQDCNIVHFFWREDLRLIEPFLSMVNPLSPVVKNTSPPGLGAQAI